MPCADCFKGHDHPGQSKGVETVLHGINTYVASPEPSRQQPISTIVVISDMFGWDTNNLRMLADSYAARTNCVVYVPDFMHGTSAPSWLKRDLDRITGKGGFWEWLMKPWLVVRAALVLFPFMLRNAPHKRHPEVVQFFDQLRCGQAPGAKLGAVGFCWGGYGATRLAHGGLASNGRTLIDAAFTAHPSELVLPGDIEEIRLPYSMAVGDVDFALPKEGVLQAAEILEQRKTVHAEVVMIPGARHGFAVRYDPNDKAEVEMADQAEDQMVRWFARHLS